MAEGRRASAPVLLFAALVVAAVLGSTARAADAQQQQQQCKSCDVDSVCMANLANVVKRWEALAVNMYRKAAYHWCNLTTG